MSSTDAVYTELWTLSNSSYVFACSLFNDALQLLRLYSRDATKRPAYVTGGVLARYFNDVRKKKTLRANHIRIKLFQVLMKLNLYT
jgi:hypothetical protein